jgi:hypothetical protein
VGEPPEARRSTIDATKAALLDSLNAQRHHVLGVLDELDATALRRVVLPTGWDCLGLAHHLAVDVERLWFRQVMGGDPVVPSDDATAAWRVDPDTAPDEVIALYRAEIARADEILLATALESEPRQWPDYFGSWRLPDLRAVLLHVITETACHAGHLDAARELIDGSTWLLL